MISFSPKKMDSDAIIAAFVQFSDEHAKYVLTPQGERIYQKITELVDELKRRGDQNRLIAQMYSTSPAVRLTAAEFYGNIDKDAARKPLIELAEGKYGYTSQQALNRLEFLFYDYFEKVAAPIILKNLHILNEPIFRDSARTHPDDWTSRVIRSLGLKVVPMTEEEKKKLYGKKS